MADTPQTHKITLTRPDGASVTVESSGTTLTEVTNIAQKLLNDIPKKEAPR